MKNSERLFLYMAIALILSVGLVKTEDEEQSHSTSVAGMEKLLQLEAKFIASLSEYANEMEKKLNVVRGALVQMQAESDKAINQTEYYLSNPLNAFSLIRRMHQDWIDWKIYMEEPIGWSHVAFIEKHKAELPNQADLQEACLAMQRLKDVYNLKVMDMATGLLNGKQYNTSLSALDTYELGQYFHKHQKYQVARDWFNATSTWLMNHTLFTPIAADQANMLYMFAAALVKIKYYSIARPILNLAMKLGNGKLDAVLLKLDADIERLSRDEPYIIPETETITSFYQTGCRGLFKSQLKFHCQYKFGPSSFLRLAPLKVELVLLDPFIVVYYDVLSPLEITELQTYARPLLRRSAVYKAGKNIFQTARTSKGTWIYKDHSNLTINIARRLEDMTDLTLEGSEGMHILNYGLGGHYFSHYDYFNISTEIDPESQKNERVATVLFYFTEVEQGGGTVFPKLQQIFNPQPGMAVFWYNLHDDGTPNNKTLHGACPVLVGSKWVMTQWIKLYPQIFTRPCRKRHTF
ncbi:prolyl 4-hydroxylase subunit alpha-2-like [Drosophila innubila]|uniref:prolyl 4-hydroxylase subunit alpha-2-like n=1 Tax=Drosophila innubila TaxID=198719 RepID=UPI00148BFC7A|nr:prolyl 4-hydroxylase subunit alpha-2-like [Drosophila innubila]